MPGRADTEKAKASRNLRRGKGKMRNRRYVTRKGPLVVYAEDSGLVRAFRNIPGVDTQSVESLNLLQVPAWAQRPGRRASSAACCVSLWTLFRTPTPAPPGSLGI